jgi:hypothetical protein
MNKQRTPIKSVYYENFPLLDGEFDSLDLDDELDFILHEAQIATHLHHPVHLQE